MELYTIDKGLLFSFKEETVKDFASEIRDVVEAKAISKVEELASFDKFFEAQSKGFLGLWHWFQCKRGYTWHC